MSENKGCTPLGISMINFRKEEEVQQNFVKHADDFWFSTNYQKNKKLLFFSGLSHFTTVINAQLNDKHIVLSFEKSQQAQGSSEPQQGISAEYQPIVEVVNEVNKSRQQAFRVLFAQPLQTLAEVALLKARRDLCVDEVEKALGSTNYILYVIGFNASCQTIEIDQMVLSSGLLKLMGKDPKTEIVKTLSNKKVDEVWTEHDYLAFTQSMLIFYKKVMDQLSERKCCLKIDNFVIFDGTRHLRAQGQIIKCRARYTYLHPFIITSEITEIERMSVGAEVEEHLHDFETAEEELKNKVLKGDKSAKVRTAVFRFIDDHHCKPIRVISNVKNN